MSILGYSSKTKAAYDFGIQFYYMNQAILSGDIAVHLIDGKVVVDLDEVVRVFSRVTPSKNPNRKKFDDALAKLGEQIIAPDLVRQPKIKNNLFA